MYKRRLVWPEEAAFETRNQEEQLLMTVRVLFPLRIWKQKPPVLRVSLGTDEAGGSPKSTNFTKLNHNSQPKSKDKDFMEDEVKVQSA